jgi:PTS system mannose-specific IID component
MKVRPATLVRVFWRCLFLQAAWNRRGMQNLGFAYAIDPALRALYPDAARREEALRRHLLFFNCHPYTAAAILGGAIHHEERVASGLEPPDVPRDYKSTLQGPLAAVGDGFFWTALRPFFGALGALGTLLAGWPAVVATLILYNAIHLVLRVHLFVAGYRKGDAIVDSVAKLSLPAVAEWLRAAGAVLAGLAAALVPGRAGLPAGPLAVAASLGGAAFGYLVLARGLRPVPAAYAAAAAGVAAALAAAGLGGGH